MADTVFSRIIAGEIPCHKVYEDDRVLAFLDVNPLSGGHTLLIPKEPATTMDQLSEESAEALGRVLPKLCRAVMRATGAKAYNVLQNNGADAHQAVDHVHFHIIPRFPDRPTGQNGLGLGWRAGAINPEAGEQLAKAIADLIDK